MIAVETVPLTIVFAAVVTIAIIANETGFRFGKHGCSAGVHVPEASVNTMVASSLALLAFLLGFTFNIAANRFDERRTAVLSEANAIGTTYLRADFLSEPSRQNVKQILRKYVDTRLGLNDPGRVAAAISQSSLLQQQLWSEAACAAKTHPESPVCALFISAVNEVIDIHAKRVAVGLYARVPLVVWLYLISVSALSMSGVGYICGLSGNRSWFGSSVFIVAFALVMTLVADLDRPRSGYIKTSQQPLIDLQAQLAAGNGG